MSMNRYTEIVKVATTTAAEAGYESITARTGVPLAWIDSMGGMSAYNPDDDAWVNLSTIGDITKLCRFEDDFFDFNTGDRWTATTTDSGTVAVIDGDGGVLQLEASGGTAADNDQTIVSSTNEIITVTAGRTIDFRARIKLTEADTDKANFAIGLSDTVAADFMQDDGDGPDASYDGAVFFKVDGGTKIQTEVSNAGTQVTDTDAGDFSSGDWHDLRILITSDSGDTEATCKFYVDGVLGATSALTIAGLEPMHIVATVKNGSAALETLLVDYVGTYFTR